MITTDIVIVSYKDKEELERCVASIKEHCVDYNLIIEDNNVCNRGFTVATNDGLKKGSAPFRWILNSDAVVLKGTQQGLIDGFSFDKKVGIVGSMQLDFDDPDRIRAGGFLRMFPGGQHEPGLVSRGDCRFPKKQTWLNGASMMISKDLIETIGYMDEAYFLIFSDSDYCLRAREAGFTCWYTPRSQILHKLKTSATPTEWHQKDMIVFMTKWGITYDPATKSFRYSERFRNLDLFP
jgi:GT2 family glycosyltransferase